MEIHSRWDASSATSIRKFRSTGFRALRADLNGRPTTDPDKTMIFAEQSHRRRIFMVGVCYK